MPFPKGRPRPPKQRNPDRGLSLPARDMLWVLQHGKDGAKPPCQSAQTMLDFYRRAPKTFMKLWIKCHLKGMFNPKE